MAIFARQKPATPTPVLVDTVAEALERWTPPTSQDYELPTTDGIAYRRPDQTQVAALKAEQRDCQAVAAERRRITAAALAQATDGLVRAQSRLRLGKGTPEDVERARDAIAVATEQHQDALRDPAITLRKALEGAQYDEDAERIALNRPMQLMAIPRLATAYAMELLAERQLATIKARRLALESATKSVSHHHENPLDTPIRERADAIVARVYDRVRDALGLTPPPRNVQIRHSPSLPRVLAENRELLEAHRKARK